MNYTQAYGTFGDKELTQDLLITKNDLLKILDCSIAICDEVLKRIREASAKVLHREKLQFFNQLSDSSRGIKNGAAQLKQEVNNSDVVTHNLHDRVDQVLRSAKSDLAKIKREAPILKDKIVGVFSSFSGWFSSPESKLLKY